MSKAVDHPCLSCGACCARYRVSFYWAEAVTLALPEHVIERVSNHLVCMAGTQSVAPRCVALQGEVGQQVSCSLYAQRPSPCHEVQLGDERCTQARMRYGLAPLTTAETHP